MALVAAPLDPEAIGKLVRYWVHFDNEIKKLNDEVRRVRASRDVYEQQVLQQLKASNMANPVIQIGDGRIIVGEDKNQQPLSYSMLEATLTKYYALKPGAKNETKDIVKFIRDQRTVHTTPCLKRLMNTSSRSRSRSNSNRDGTETP